MHTTNIDAITRLLRAALRPFFASLMVLLSLPALAQKTVSYYAENVGERIDRVLACKDGAEDPASLGCRNALMAQGMDIDLSGRFVRKLELAKWRAESEPNKRLLNVLTAMETVSNSVMNVTCVHMTDGKAPTNRFSKASLKVALDEKFLEQLPSQPGKYRTTARGDEFLLAHQQTSKTGFFCPIRQQYSPDIKIVEFKDLTAQYKGKKSESGNVVKTLAIATVELPLGNTQASVWYSKKVFPVSLPATGLATGRYLLVEYVNHSGVVGTGGILSVNGQTIVDYKVEQEIEKFYK